MKISVIGLGYVGLPTAALFASKGMQVIGVDINQQIIHTINNGNVHIIEPDLNQLVSTVVESGHLSAVNVPQPADVFIIAVPTPIKTDKTPDLLAFESAVTSIAAVLKKGNLIIIESTVPLNTVKNAAYRLAELRPDLIFPIEPEIDADIGMAYCPERVLPGHTLRELREVPRTIGGLNKASAHDAAKVFRIISESELTLTDVLTAEMVKLVENAYRDVNIAFANELSLLCDDYHINVQEVIKLANQHPRVNILKPGAGVGGHCISIDPWFLVDACPKKARLIHTARKVNEAKTEYVYQQILEKTKKNATARIAILGLSYKANSNDIRESPAIKIIQKLANLNKDLLYITDPFVKKLPKNLNEYDHIQFVSLEDAILSADIIAILTGHDQYHGLKQNFNLQNKQLIDAVGVG